MIEMAPIPEAYLDLFAKRSFAHLATVMPDGSPQVTPIWVDYDGQHVLVNTARGRIKDRNMRPGVWVALAIMDADNPYRYLQVRGPLSRKAKRVQRSTFSAWRTNTPASHSRCVRARCG